MLEPEQLVSEYIGKFNASSSDILSYYKMLKDRHKKSVENSGKWSDIIKKNMRTVGSFYNSVQRIIGTADQHIFNLRIKLKLLSMEYATLKQDYEEALKIIAEHAPSYLPNTLVDAIPEDVKHRLTKLNSDTDSSLNN